MNQSNQSKNEGCMFAYCLFWHQLQLFKEDGSLQFRKQLFSCQLLKPLLSCLVQGRLLSGLNMRSVSLSEAQTFEADLIPVDKLCRDKLGPVDKAFEGSRDDPARGAISISPLKTPLPLQHEGEPTSSLHPPHNPICTSL